MSEQQITLEMLGTLLRQVQAEQRNLRTEQATIRDLITETVPSALSVFQRAILDRIAGTEALMEQRFTNIVNVLTEIMHRLDAVEARLADASEP